MSLRCSSAVTAPSSLKEQERVLYMSAVSQTFSTYGVASKGKERLCRQYANCV